MSESWKQPGVMWCLAVVSVVRVKRATEGLVVRGAAVTVAEARETQTSLAAVSCGRWSVPQHTWTGEPTPASDHSHGCHCKHTSRSNFHLFKIMMV